MIQVFLLGAVTLDTTQKKLLLFETKTFII